ncbi:hypothetical protein [Arthrobacter sp. NA-172]
MVAVVDCSLDGRLVQCHKREFDGDEEARAKNQEHAGEKEQPLH